MTKPIAELHDADRAPLLSAVRPWMNLVERYRKLTDRMLRDRPWLMVGYFGVGLTWGGTAGEMSAIYGPPIATFAGTALCFPVFGVLFYRMWRERKEP